MESGDTTGGEGHTAFQQGSKPTQVPPIVPTLDKTGGQSVASNLSCVTVVGKAHWSLVRTNTTKIREKLKHILKALNCAVKMSYMAQMADGPFYRKWILNIFNFCH